MFCILTENCTDKFDQKFKNSFLEFLYKIIELQLRTYHFLSILTQATMKLTIIFALCVAAALAMPADVEIVRNEYNINEQGYDFV